MNPDFTLIWPLSCLKDGDHLYDNCCPQRYGLLTKRLRRPARRVVVVHPGYPLLIFRSKRKTIESTPRSLPSCSS